MTTTAGTSIGATTFLLVLLAAGSFYAPRASAYRILAVSGPLSGHANPLLAISRGLLARGHNVTFATCGTFAVHAALLQHANFTYVNAPLDPEYEAVLATFGRPTHSILQMMRMMRTTMLEVHRAISVGLLGGRGNATFHRGDFDLLLGSVSSVFDLAEALSPVDGQRLPIVMNTLFLSPLFARPMHLPSGPLFAVMPLPSLGLGWFVDEVVQSLANVAFRVLTHTHDNNARTVREELRRKTPFTSLSLDPQHERHALPLVLLSRPRPLDSLWGLDPPHVHRVGILTPSADGLPQELEQWLDESDETLYVSLGTVVAPTRDELSLMMRALRRFIDAAPQRAAGSRRVLWSLKKKFHILLDATLLPPPYALRIEAWVPQRDVLQHAKVRAFFTHGGYNSISEAVVFGKPMIGVPFFGDQPLNLQAVRDLQLAVTLTVETLSDMEHGEQMVTDALLTVWNDQQYSERAQRMAAIVGPPDIAVHRSVELIEYLLRVGGSTDLFKVRYQTSLGSVTRHLLILATFVGLLVLMLYGVYRLFKFLVLFLYRRFKGLHKEKAA